jgi:hypothetical protein
MELGLNIISVLYFQFMINFKYDSMHYVTHEWNIHHEYSYTSLWPLCQVRGKMPYNLRYNA